MDRGVKIAIFVASIAALCLGLIWDQVLSHARVMVEEQSEDVLSAEVMDASIGSPDIERAHPPEDLAPWEQPQQASEVEILETEVEAAPATNSNWLEYELKSGDSPHRLAYKVFPERGLKTDDLLNANPDSKWRVGNKIRIPPAAGTSHGRSTPPPSNATSTTPPSNGAAVEYIVQQDDSWWRIWEKHKARCKTWQEIEAANPGVKLVPGAKIKIP